MINNSFFLAATPGGRASRWLIRVLQVGLVAVVALAEVPATAGAQDTAISPNQTLVVTVTDATPESVGSILLVEVATSQTLSTIDLTSHPLFARPAFLWNDDSTAVAISIRTSRTDSAIYAFTAVPNGMFLSSKPSNFDGSFAKLAEPPEHWVRVERKALSWRTKESHSGRFIDIQTRFWDKKAQRFTVHEGVYIPRSGQPMGR